MTTILTIDIGGTKCEAALWQSSCTQPMLLQKLRFSSNFADETELFAQIHPLPADLEAAVIAVAGRIDSADGEIHLTNNPCTLNIAKIRAALPAHCRLALLNDLEALAHAIPYLPPSALLDVNPHADFSRQYSPLPCLAAAVGTGFGAAVCLPGGRVLPTEAGHTVFAPTNSAQAEICRKIAAAHSTNSDFVISTEFLLSGAGLSRIHHALTGQNLTPADITLALSQNDSAAHQTITMFSAILGAALGNLALISLPSGVYLAGGVLQHLAPYIDKFALMQAFSISGPFAGYLAALPLQIITDDAPTLLGAVMYAEHFLLG